MAGRGFTVMIHRDGALESRQIRVPRWAVRMLAVTSALAAAGVAAMVVAYGPIAAAALRAPLLERQVAQLSRENARVNELARMLDNAEARYAHLRGMLGANVVPALAGGDSGADSGTTLAPEERLYVAPPLYARAPDKGAVAVDSAGSGIPSRWPLSVRSFRTRGLASGDSSELHAGIDLAVPSGSDARAAAAGVVRQAGSDSSYGLFVLIEHEAGYETMYGHLSRILVARGDRVRAAQVIALTGNSGRSTAPHLHFEVRRNGRSVDPLTLVREGR